jgi:hypothetical protein
MIPAFRPSPLEFRSAGTGQHGFAREIDAARAGGDGEVCADLLNFAAVDEEDLVVASSAGLGVDELACDDRYSFGAGSADEDSQQDGNSHLISIWTERM